MTGEEAVARYPGLRLPRDFACLLEKDGGILLADKALATVQVWCENDCYTDLSHDTKNRRTHLVLQP